MESQKSDIIYGIRPLLEAVRSGKQIDKVLIRQGLTGDLASELLGALKHSGIPFQHVPYESFAKFRSRNHQGVVGFLAPIALHALEELLPKVIARDKTPFLLILDRITDVRNFGAIVRTAECAGVDAIIVPAKGAAQIGSDSVKTSAGALHHIPICRVGSLKVTISYLKENGVKVISASEGGSKSLFEADLSGAIALVMGAEDTGITPDVLRLSDAVVRIPILGQIGSLNVSVAAGVMMYEVIRQRGLQP